MKSILAVIFKYNKRGNFIWDGNLISPNSINSVILK